MSEPFIGQIQTFGFNFAPRGWAFCDGQLLSIAQNTALFALLGTTYGGDGRTTFGLPDLRGRVPLHEGTGPGLSPHPLGQRAGTENTILNVNQMASHSHTQAKGKMRATASPANSNDPTGNSVALGALYSTDAPTVDMATDSVVNPDTNDTGGGNSHDNMQPYLVLNTCIALVGIFPSRN